MTTCNDIIIIIYLLLFIYYYLFIYRIEFTLDDGYDIDWHVPVAMETNQLFQTSSFQIDDRKITFTGTTDGTTFVFNVRDQVYTLKLCKDPNLI